MCALRGEEFACVLPRTDLDGAMHLAELLRARVETGLAAARWIRFERGWLNAALRRSKGLA